MRHIDARVDLGPCVSLYLDSGSGVPEETTTTLLVRCAKVYLNCLVSQSGIPEESDAYAQRNRRRFRTPHRGGCDQLLLY